MELYRGKDSQGNWVYGGVNESKTFIVSKFQFISVNPDTVTQNTGVKDCEGNWIYEGDILESAEKPDSYSFGFWDSIDKDGNIIGNCGKMKVSGKPFRHVVKWHDERAAFCLFLPLSNIVAGSRPLNMFVKDDQMRVIGNIFDNPELERE